MTNLIVKMKGEARRSLKMFLKGDEIQDCDSSRAKYKSVCPLISFSRTVI